MPTFCVRGRTGAARGVAGSSDGAGDGSPAATQSGTAISLPPHGACTVPLLAESHRAARGGIVKHGGPPC